MFFSIFVVLSHCDLDSKMWSIHLWFTMHHWCKFGENLLDTFQHMLLTMFWGKRGMHAQTYRKRTLCLQPHYAGGGIGLDWIEQGLTSPPTQYRLFGRQWGREAYKQPPYGPCSMFISWNTVTLCNYLSRVSDVHWPHRGIQQQQQHRHTLQCLHIEHLRLLFNGHYINMPCLFNHSFIQGPATWAVSCIDQR